MTYNNLKKPSAPAPKPKPTNASTRAKSILAKKLRGAE